jgi:hypothetical protein
MRGVSIVPLCPLRLAKRSFSAYFTPWIPTEFTFGALLVPFFGQFLEGVFPEIRSVRGYESSFSLLRAAKTGGRWRMVARNSIIFREDEEETLH